jgi:tRNA (cytidine56-2'-O)-methyltransferase
MLPMIEVLRLGHRTKRDERVTTHVCLVARAFGAHKVLISSKGKDTRLEQGIASVNRRFGGDLVVETGVQWRPIMRAWKAADKGPIVHLTMYGLPLDEVMERLRKGGGKDTLIVVGSEKVPGEVYGLADLNVAVGNQPHSEVAALAVFLDRFFDGKAISRRMAGELEIVPMERGKKVVRR